MKIVIEFDQKDVVVACQEHYLTYNHLEARVTRFANSTYIKEMLLSEVEYLKTLKEKHKNV